MPADLDARSRPPQPNTCEKAAIETASVIISMMIASSFMKSSAISFIDPVPSLFLILLLTHVQQRPCRRRPAASRFLSRLSKRRLGKDLKISRASKRTRDTRGPRPLSVRDRGRDIFTSRFETSQR